MSRMRRDEGATMKSGRTCPRRIITRGIGFLLLLSGGAIINVAVAWGGAMWSPTARCGVTAIVHEVPARFLPHVPSDWTRRRKPTNARMIMYQDEDAAWSCEIAKFGIAEMDSPWDLSG